MNNAIQRFILEDLNIRGAVVCLDSVWQDMLTDRAYPETAQKILGEICATTLLLGQNLKQKGRLTIQLRGDGPISMLVMDCNDQLHVRGMIKSDQDIPNKPVPELLGQGQLVLSLDMPSMRNPYQSIVPLEGDTVSEIFEHYLKQSDQLPSRLFLSTSEQAILGILLQKLPSPNQVVNDDDWTRINLLAATVHDPALFHIPGNDVLTRLFNTDTIRIFDAQPVHYGCYEDLNKIHSMLRSLGRSEIDAILSDKGEIVISDDICNREYHFDATAIDHIFNKPENQTIH